MNYFTKYRNFCSGIIIMLSIFGNCVASNDADLSKGFSCSKPSCRPSKPCKLSSCPSCCKPKPCKPSSCSSCNSSSATCGCNLSPCCFRNVICVNSVPTTLTSSGVYCLASNVPAACDSTGPLITIAANNVVLNLTGNTLSGGQRGIFVNPNLSSIQINNGAIVNTDAEAIFVSAGCQSVKLVDLQVISCNQSKCSLGIGCIVFNGIAGGRISACLLSNVQVSDGVGTGIKLINVDNSNISKTNVFSMSSVNPTLDSVGIYASGNYNTFEYCKVGHVINNLAGLNAYGFQIVSSINAILSVCEADSVTSISPAADAVGFYILNSENTLLDHCTSSASSALASGALPITANNAASFISQGSTTTQMIICSASSNTSPKAGIANGFVLNNDTLDTLTNCISQSNGTDGFRVLATCSHCLVRLSAANGNGGFGFDYTGPVPPPLTNVFYSNFAARNGTPPGPLFNFSASIPNVSPLGSFFPPAGQSDNINGG